jgi:hypothetical protein
MSLHRLRARLDRLEQVVVDAIGEDPEKERQRFALLKQSKLSGATLTAAEAAEFERLENYLHYEPFRRHALLSARKRSGGVLNDAQTAELARLDDFIAAWKRDYSRLSSLSSQKHEGSLTDAEQNELAELEKRFDDAVTVCYLIRHLF